MLSKASKLNTTLYSTCLSLLGHSASVARPAFQTKWGSNLKQLVRLGMICNQCAYELACIAGTDAHH